MARRFAADVIDRLQRLPGVTTVGGSFGLPLTDTHFWLSFTVDGRPQPPPNDEPSVQVRVATPDYFKAMGIRLLRGRIFGDADRYEAPSVIVITDELARRYFPDEDPLGKRLRMGWARKGHRLGGEIIGVVANVKQLSLDAEAVPTLYAAVEQWPVNEMSFVVSSTTSAASLAPAIRQVVRAIDPHLPVFDLHAMSELLSGALAQPRFYWTLLAASRGRR